MLSNKEKYYKRSGIGPYRDRLPKYCRILKVLYGTGAVRLNDETGQPERTTGIRYTIKDGIVYDAQRLLADVREMVVRQKSERGDLAEY